jgi:hypothetical protein
VHSIWYGNLVRRIQERRADTEQFVLEGGAGDHGEYRYQVGYLQGLKDALDLALEVDQEQLGFTNVNSPRVAAADH